MKNLRGFKDQMSMRKALKSTLRSLRNSGFTRSNVFPQKGNQDHTMAYHVESGRYANGKLYSVRNVLTLLPSRA